MSDDKKSLIPGWQQKDSSPTSQPQTADDPKTVHDAGGPPKSEPLQSEVAPLSAGFSVEDIKKFLTDPGVRNAPEEKKVSFLEAKGVDRDIIDTLLKEVAAESFTPQGETLNAAEFKKQQDVARAAERRPTSAPPTETQQRDVPPVVTYPEFLVKPQKPPPLVTVGRLVNTTYIAGSLALFFYGASEYLIKPMTATLTAARHDLAAHAGEHVDDLNSRLEKVVSKIPTPAKSAPPELNANPSAQDATDENSDADPAELYHRDVGVQTSPPLSRRSSSASSSDAASLTSRATRQSVIERQADRMQSLRTHMQSLLDGEEKGLEDNGSLEASLSSVRDYCNGLVYSPPYSVDYGSWNAETSSLAPRDKNDAVSQFRNEIRGVKGVLLSAKRFPTPAARVGA